MSQRQSSERTAAQQQPLSLLQTFRTVAWSFFGVRRRAGHDQDMQKLKPLHLVLAGVVAAALFVLAVMLLVRWVVSSGVAT